MTTVTDWSTGYMTGLTAGLTRFFGAMPNILGAIILLAIGWLIAGIIGGLVAKLCRAIHVDTVSDRVGINDYLKKSGSSYRSSSIIGEIITWVVRLVFIEMAAEQLGMPQISLIINQMLSFIPNIIVAVFIIGAGAFIGQMLGGIVRGAAYEAKVGNPTVLAKLSSGAVMAFAIIAALNELNIAPIVINTLLIGLVGALSLALGLAFGLGGRDTAARLTERWVGQLETTAKTAQTAMPLKNKASVIQGSTTSPSSRLGSPI